MDVNNIEGKKSPLCLVINVCFHFVPMTAENLSEQSLTRKSRADAQLLHIDEEQAMEKPFYFYT